MQRALYYMNDHEFSQIIVRWRGNVRLLSGEGIVKWITDLLDHGKDHIAGRAVGEAARAWNRMLGCFAPKLSKLL